jgi:anti-sigma regulatory factor (Ser/Thr protein kinase)
LQGQPAQDDIAVVCAECSIVTTPQLSSRPEAKTIEELEDSAVEIEDSVDQVTWKVDITLTAAQLKQLDVVPMLMNITSTIEGGQDDSAIFMVLSELFNNALDHGVLKLDSTLKQHEDGMSRYYDERAARMASLTEGQIEVGLERIKSHYGDWLKIYLRDSGDGFDYSAFSNGGEVEGQRYGRGLNLLKGLCDILEYGGNGSEVVAYLDLETLAA